MTGQSPSFAKENPMTDLAPQPTSFVSKLIADHQSDTHKSDQEMADELGLTENLLAAIKRGQIKLPVTKISQLAGATRLRPAFILSGYLRETAPDLLQVIEDTWKPADLTSNEQQLLKDYRRLAKGRDAAPVVIKGVAIIAPRAQG
jgi:transcriptional regulator with XRE-family HTH domain